MLEGKVGSQAVLRYSWEANEIQGLGKMIFGPSLFTESSSTQCALVFTHPSHSLAQLCLSLRSEENPRRGWENTWPQCPMGNYGENDDSSVRKMNWKCSSWEEGSSVVSASQYTSFEGLCFCFVRGGVFQRFMSLLSKGRVCRRSVEVAHRWAWMFATPSLPCLWFKARRVFQRNQETNQKSDWLPLKIPLVFRVWTDYR